MLNLTGKVAVVTGATGGIGAAIAEKFSQLGANLVLNYRKETEEFTSFVETLRSNGVEVLTVKCDITNSEETKVLIDEAIKTFGKVDILINNAGVTRDQLLMRMSEDDFDMVINTNLKGAFNLTKAVVKPMMKQRSGKIINITSVIGLVGNAGQANYAASKAGLIGFTKSIAKEVATRNINVNAVAPGFIETKMTDVLGDDIKSGILTKIPMNKMGQPEDIANVVAFLSSDASNYITGQVITVDGGMVM